MADKVIIKTGQLPVGVAASIPNLTVVNTGITAEEQQQYQKYLQDIEKARVLQAAQARSPKKI